MSALTELLQAIRKSRDVIDDALRQAGTLDRRATLLAKSLLGLYPGCRFCACWLHRDGDSFLSVVDEAGGPRPEWVSLLGDKLAGNKRFARREQPSKKGRSRLPDHVLAVEPIQWLAEAHGAIGLGLPPGAELERSAVAQALLMSCSERVASKLREESCDHLREEVAELAYLANVGEIAGPLAHEFNNFLNVVMLHVTVLQAELPEGLQADLKEMKNQGKSIATTIKQFQDYKQRRQLQQKSVDLNRVVQAAVRALRPHSEQGENMVIDVSTMEHHGTAERNSRLVPVRLELATNLAHVVSSEADLKRVCLLLLKNWGGAATATGAGIGVRTATSEHSVQLRVEDSGASLAPDCLKQMFDPQVCCREGTNSLELAACKAIVRRLGGAIRCENGEKQGAAVVVELPLAADVLPT